MASSQQGSTEQGHGSRRRRGAPRRVWTTKEDETLIIALKQLVADGEKSDNGFKPNYLAKLEAAMKKKDPYTDLKGNPHINSKLTAWKRNYYSLRDVLSKSGVGFNLLGNFKIDCLDDDLWASYERGDSNLYGMRKKEWTFYEDWKEIFGKDRATGDNAEDTLEAQHYAERQPNTHQQPTAHQQPNAYFAHESTGDYYVNLDNINETNNADDSVCQEELPAVQPKNKGKKRISDDGLEQVCSLLGEISRNSNLRFEALANKVGYDHDMGKARMEVYEKLGNITGLSKFDKFAFFDKLSNKVERLEFFMGLPEEDREDYVIYILKEG